MITENQINKTNELYSYKLTLKPHDTIIMKIDSLIKKKINHQVDIAISLREMIEHLETKKLNHIWFREKLEHKLQLKKLFSKKEKKIFDHYIDEFYLQYLLKVRELIQEQNKEVPEEESNKFEELFQLAIDSAIFEMVDNDHCIHEKAANEFIQLAMHTPSKKVQLVPKPIISDNLLLKIEGNNQAKNNIAITALMAIGKSLPTPRPAQQNTNDKDNLNEHKHLICARLCNTIHTLNLSTFPILNSPNADFERGIFYLRDLYEQKVRSPYIAPNQAQLIVNSINKSQLKPM